MKITDTQIADIKIIEPDIFKDQRGYFFESWNQKKYADAGISCNWVQDNESKSTYGVIRGLHYQLPPYTQAKLLRVISGKILDVAVDIRKNSPTFGKHIATILSDENKRQLFIPRGFAHGFAVLSESAIVQYKCDNLYMPSHERGIRFDDPTLGIDWQIEPDKVISSGKDLKLPFLADADITDFDSMEEKSNA
jgi:dTDP-4-dehydrorhamnose 3,5-epimerase